MIKRPLSRSQTATRPCSVPSATSPVPILVDIQHTVSLSWAHSDAGWEDSVIARGTLVVYSPLTKRHWKAWRSCSDLGGWVWQFGTVECVDTMYNHVCRNRKHLSMLGTVFMAPFVTKNSLLIRYSFIQRFPTAQCYIHKLKCPLFRGSQLHNGGTCIIYM